MLTPRDDRAGQRPRDTGDDERHCGNAMAAIGVNRRGGMCEQEVEATKAEERDMPETYQPPPRRGGTAQEPRAQEPQAQQHAADDAQMNPEPAEGFVHRCRSPRELVYTNFVSTGNLVSTKRSFLHGFGPETPEKRAV